MKKEKLALLFKKYLEGDCTLEEIQTIEQWYQSHDENPDDDRLGNTDDAKNLENKILGKIKDEIFTRNESIEITSNNLRPFRVIFKIAASLLLLALFGAGAYFYNKSNTHEAVDKADLEINRRTEKITNATASMTTHRLSDGSVINLHPGGSIEFPRVFSKKQRDIQLSGEAFFDVAKEKDRPFIINTGQVTIRVLGTSFNVKAYHGSKEISVAVKTGKVSVSGSNKKSLDDEIILTPNQEVIYYTDQSNFSKKLVDDPQIILEKPTLFEMEYDGTPVGKIFDVLTQNYGIEIIYDKQLLSGCGLTTSMSEEGLYERVEIICQAIGAEYEIKDGKIIINSSGCQ